MGQIIIGNSYEDSEDFIKQCDEYKKYIDLHKANVIKAFVKIFREKTYNSESINISNDEWKEAIKKVSYDIKYHDESKYEDEEFYPYRRHFYPTAKEKIQEDKIEDEESFDNAWKHHYLNNDHHPHYYSNL